MGMQVGGSKLGIVAEMNVVPLIDVLLVLLIIFMMIPHTRGLDALVPQQSDSTDALPPAAPVVIQVLEDGSLKINQEQTTWVGITARLEEIFKARADRVAFIRGDKLVEFSQVAKVIDILRGLGLSVGLMPGALEQSR